MARARRSKATLAGSPSTDRSATLAELLANVPVGAGRAVAHTVAIAWWDTANRALGTSFAPPSYGEDVGQLDATMATLAVALGAALCDLSPEEANAELGALYARLLPQPHRKEHGVFYTPRPLVQRLLDQAQAAGYNWASGNIVDPSCGAGAFLVEAARRITLAMRVAAPEFVVAAISSRLRGWDLDPFASWLAQLSVELVLLPQTAASGRRIGSVTETKDSLADWRAHKGKFDLVMGNPAFGRVPDSPALRQRFARSLFGHPNLYGLFMDLAVDLASKPSGLIAYVTPTSYLGGQYFKRLRRLLALEAPPISIDILEPRNQHFEDVLQEVALSVFRKGGRARRVASATLVANGHLSADERGRFELPKNPESPWIIPRKSSDVELVRRLSSLTSRLSDWGYRVSTGPLVWNRKRDRLSDNRGSLTYPVVWASSIRTGRFDPAANRRNAPLFYHASHVGDPNLVTKPCILLQRTTSKEQHRRLVAATLPKSYLKHYGAAAVENHLNMVVPLTARPPVPMRVVQSFLDSAIADAVIRCISGSVALSATELEAMPLPAADEIVAAFEAANFEDALTALYSGSR